MNTKECDNRIAFLKAFSKGTLEVIEVCKTEQDKELMLNRIKGKRGVKNITVRSREEQDGIERELKEKIKKETQRRLSKLERAEPC